jgi:hypothetical protein
MSDLTGLPSSVPSKSPAAASEQFIPPQINKLEETGLAPLFLQDLALKILYFQGYLTGYKIADAMCLPFTGTVDIILEALKRDKLIEVRSSQMGLGEEHIYLPLQVQVLFMREKP